jgi:tetratricopeptide (TPR) repeat protein
MRRVTILILAIIAAFSAYSQTYIQNGDNCFENGDYTCAISKYNEAFKLASGKDKQIAEIKLTRAKWCAEHIKTANQAFNNKNYTVAKEEYQKVLDSNPKNRYALSKLEDCNKALNPPATPALRKATTAVLTDIWNNKYGNMPERRQKLIDAGIDPDDAQKRINNGEGKPATFANQKITLGVSNQNISFTASGSSTIIDVITNSNDYKIILLPPWCKIKSKSPTGFSLVCDANTSGLSRSSWFKVTAGDMEIKVYISQAGLKNSTTSYGLSKPIKNRKCFNCPKTKSTLGLTLGYMQKSFDNTEGVQFGLRIEPLFKYGFGINTGVNFAVYSNNLFRASNEGIKLEQPTINIPLHLEYRLNFSKWFNVFIYGGAGIHIITDSKNYLTPTTFDYGGGLRINHLQFNLGQSLYLGDMEHIRDLGARKLSYHKLIFSVSYMF